MSPSADDPAADHAQLDAIAAELFTLPPEEFTAARNARAAASDRALAARVKALRKPTASAWAVDLLARDGQLGEALELAGALREAQDDLDAAELGRLSRQRRALVTALATRAVELARDRGVAVSASARTDVEKTLNAAVMDAAAAAAVMTGRLVRPLEAGGFEAVDVSDAVGGSLPGVPDAPAPTRDDLAERRARKAAERALREAERASGEAERELARVEAKLAKVRERGDLLRERIQDLRTELARLETDADKADDEAARLDQKRSDAASTARAAARQADRARESLE
ncbi:MULTISPECIES: transposase [unclassified Microbacterium]|uniref:transposase n=1 Tax=unclassified Microbacterium TaxID=2609290 RepID=UPI00214B488B|nr:MULTISPECIES: transposase [unclassified Microbacterium]MCR2808751.1 transposase [Microbacterium sp. zg.B185]WIM18821.1 transposase [Microbacterium sp. zg-B185]